MNKTKSTHVHYVAGLLISQNHKLVALIRKARPEWQRGRLNGIGGHVDPGETPKQAMIREFQEETGASVTNWKHFCTLQGKNWTVDWFKSFGIIELQGSIEEPVLWREVSSVMISEEVIPNVRWLLLMALEDVTGVVTDHSN